MTTSNATAPPQKLPLGSNLTVATINVNGAHADQQDGSRIVPRVKVVLRHMKELQVQVFAMQEPHLQMGSAQLESRSSSLTAIAKQHGYGCRAQLSPPPHTRGGGVALFWQKDWTEVASASISPRLLLTNLLSPEGLVYTVVSAHFSDKPDKRKSQWLRLKEAMAVFPFSQHVLLLADHNSVITPGDDSEYGSEHDNLPPAAGARAEELGTLLALSMRDMWQEDAPDHDDARRLKGWTWGFHTEQDESPHRTRIDKIHVSGHMSFSIVRCYAKKKNGLWRPPRGGNNPSLPHPHDSPTQAAHPHMLPAVQGHHSGPHPATKGTHGTRRRVVGTGTPHHQNHRIHL